MYSTSISILYNCIDCQETKTQLTYRAEAVNDGSDGGDGFAGTLERLVLTKLSTDGRGYQGERTNDETT